MKTQLGLGSTPHTCNLIKAKCRPGQTVRSQIRNWPRMTLQYLLAINNIQSERNNRADQGAECARFGSTNTEIGTLHRSPKGLRAKMKLSLPRTVAHRDLSFRPLKTNAKRFSRIPVRDLPYQHGKCPSSERKQNLR